MNRFKHYYHDIRNAIRSRVSRDTYIVFTGNLVNAFLVLGYTVLVSRNMSVENFGIYSFATAILVVVVELSDSGLTTTVIRFASQHLTEGKEWMAKTIFYISLRFRVLSSIILCSTGFIFASWIAENIFSKPEIVAPFRLALVAVFLINIQNFISSVLLSYKKFAKKVSYNIFISTVKILFLLGFIYLSNHGLAPSPAVSIIIISTVIGLFLGIFIVPTFPIRRPSTQQEYNQIKHEVFHFSRWITVSLIASMVILRLDTFFLTRLTSLETVGFYNAAINFSNFFSISSAAITTTFLPYLSEYQFDRLRRFYKTVLKFTPFVFVAIAALVLIAPTLIIIVFGDRYTESIPILRILFLANGLILLINPINVMLYRLNKAKTVAIVHLCQLAIILVLNIILIPPYGAIGAAWSRVSINVFSWLILLVITRRIFLKNEISINR